MNYLRLIFLTAALLSVTACASFTPRIEPQNRIVEKPKTLLQPHKESMLQAPKKLDLSDIPNELSLKQSIDLNKTCISSHKTLEASKLDWITYYGYLKQINPDNTLAEQALKEDE